MNRAVICGLAAFAVWLGTVTFVRSDEPKPKKAEDAPPGTIILKIDGKNLPPDLLKKLIELQGPTPAAPAPEKVTGKPVPQPEKPAPAKPAPEKPAAKPTESGISLSEAIARAEKATGGTAVKAEKREIGGFVIEVVNKSGEKSKVVLDATGKPADEKKPEPKKPEPKKEEPKKPELKKPEPKKEEPKKEEPKKEEPKKEEPKKGNQQQQQQGTQKQKQ